PGAGRRALSGGAGPGRGPNRGSAHRGPSGGPAPGRRGGAMDAITMMPARRLTDDTHVLTAWVPLPGYGLLCGNAFVVEAREPVLVDSGVPVVRDAFMRELRTIIDPADLRWLWLTHADP